MTTDEDRILALTTAQAREFWIYLRLGKIIVQRVTVIVFGMYNEGCSDTDCLGIKIRTHAAKLTNVRIARFRECRD